MPARMLYIHALSPIHTGIGQSSGVIDLPVAREKHTGYPFLPGSSLKGVLRDAARPKKGDATETVFWQAFGPETDHADKNSGALQFTDGRLLAMPIRSFYGTFAWVTCRETLMRWKNDFVFSDLTNTLAIPPAPALDALRVATPGKLSEPNSPAPPAMVYLEDFDLNVAADDDSSLNAIAKAVAKGVFDDPDWQALLIDRFAMVHNDLFNHFSQLATDVTARIKIARESKTVDKGQLWYEEAIPAESIFSCPLSLEARHTANETAFFGFVETAAMNTLQIGGKASVGRGLIRLRVGG